jgi:hypothetical protein
MASADKKGSGIEDRWWVDRDKYRLRPRNQDRPGGAGAAFFRAVEGYDQAQALEHLTDVNLKLLAQGAPPLGGWGYVSLLKERSPSRDIERVKRRLPLPSFARAVIVDSGRSLRAVVTGSPVGERILEFNFIEEASFDCWINGEWVCERTFRHRDELLREAPKLLIQYLEKARKGNLSPP